jgi:tetratricopeptide (TPR) repeat protein
MTSRRLAQDDAVGGVDDGDFAARSSIFMISSRFAWLGLGLIFFTATAAAADPAAPVPVRTTPKLEILNKQIAANAEDAKAYSNRGYTLALLGRKEEARADLKRALELDCKAPMRNRVGWALFNLGDYAAAVREFEAAAERSGHAAHYDYYSLVLGYWGTGNTQRALENYDLAVQRDPRLGENKTLHERTLEWTPLERRAMHETYVLWSKAWRR